ncbi:unnamed protein product [Prunus armeniaca]|uniref:Uncharacterized protein n=1 Tax=Prunus armeniaca TaxID=36596 RepID=A0A6J5TYT5_PRUAR|nr:unnamed protein product [Prunus armeniaca]
MGRGRLRSRGLRMLIADKSHSQRDVLGCSKRLKNWLFFVMLRLLLSSSLILESFLSFPVLVDAHVSVSSYSFIVGGDFTYDVVFS